MEMSFLLAKSSKIESEKKKYDCNFAGYAYNCFPNVNAIYKAKNLNHKTVIVIVKEKSTTFNSLCHL